MKVNCYSLVATLIFSFGSTIVFGMDDNMTSDETPITQPIYDCRSEFEKELKVLGTPCNQEWYSAFEKTEAELKGSFFGNRPLILTTKQALVLVDVILPRTIEDDIGGNFKSIDMGLLEIAAEWDFPKHLVGNNSFTKFYADDHNILTSSAEYGKIRETVEEKLKSDKIDFSLGYIIYIDPKCHFCRASWHPLMDVQTLQ